MCIIKGKKQTSFIEADSVSPAQGISFLPSFRETQMFIATALFNIILQSAQISPSYFWLKLCIYSRIPQACHMSSFSLPP